MNLFERLERWCDATDEATNRKDDSAEKGARHLVTEQVRIYLRQMTNVKALRAQIRYIIRLARPIPETQPLYAELTRIVGRGEDRTARTSQV